MSFAAAWAISIVWSSSDSRTPRRRPSMIGRMPTLGNPLWVKTVWFIFSCSFLLAWRWIIPKSHFSGCASGVRTGSEYGADGSMRANET